MRSVVVPVLTALVLAGTSACSAFSGDDGTADDDGVRVVAAFYPLQYAAQRVGGDLVDVENLTVPGQEPHELGVTIQETAAIARADLVVFELGFQPAIDDAVETSAEGSVIDAAEVVDLLHAEDHGDEAAHDEHDEGEEDHDHGDLDPHFWQDPVRLADLADAIADELADLDPDNAEDYAANADDLRADLEALDTAYATGLEGCERDIVVVSHDAFAYLTAYGLEFEPIAGLSPDAEPTPSDLARLNRLIEEEGITTVFGERLAPQDLTDTLARDAGVTTAVLDPVEGLTDETEGEDYISLMTKNLDALRTANGCP
ncbi:metal ABC transporter substrate-binding protein [Nocardioides sp.]|uniref:metal ABC transporter substrate-binding protein n=1 Tax=Nocardioides sp. TaxID=35761 RepID=UPI001A23C4DA|nr:metal ABC transporter substrate-binding protein [Nocardioides sp.]MBJ7357147.1 zinc ABC transporter substrate-binding protein [Nocardioides sp.]